MSVFGDKLKNFIESNNLKIYQLAKTAGVDRSTIHKVTSNGRVPSLEFVGRIAEALPISPLEKRELLEAYEIQKLGEYKYNQREQVKSIIENMTAKTDRFVYSKISQYVPTHYEKESFSAYGNLSVNNLVSDILNTEFFSQQCPKVCFSMPHDYTFFFDLLLLNYSKTDKTNIDCLVEFCRKQNSADKKNVNLDVLNTIFPFMLLHKEGFNAHYLYTAVPVKNVSLSVMPYFIITSGAVLTLTPDLKTAMFYQGYDIVECYKNIFAGIKADARPLLKQYNTLEDTLTHFYASTNGNSHIKLRCVEPQPCFASYFNHELIDKQIRMDFENRDHFVDLATSYYKFVADSSSGSVSVFTKEGLDYFAETGILTYLPNKYALPFSVEDRIMLIENSINDLKSEKKNFRIINQSKFRIPTNIFIDVFSDTCMNISLMNQGETYTTKIVFINEDSILSAFDDFITSIIDSDCVYTKEETLTVLYKTMNTIV